MTDREKLIEILRVPIFPHELVDPTEAVADYLLDNGVVVREKGEWIWDKKFGDYKCSICGGYDITMPAFCRTCGADMRKGENG